MKPRALFAVLLMTMLVGCGASHDETYMVSVKNETTQPLTIGFTKEGEPYQEDFMAPDQIALDRQVNPEIYSWGILIEPGKTATTKKPLTATLEDGNIAYLRVYRGHINMLSMLAISQGSPSRIDAPLMPGKNSVIIIDRNSRLALIKGP